MCPRSKKHSSIKLPIFFKTCSCSLVNSQTNFDDVSMYLKFGHKSITLSKNFTLIFSYKGQSTTKCFSSSISLSEQFVHFLSDLIMFLYLPVSIFNGWALTLILHIDCRILKLLICKYFSFSKWVFYFNKWDIILAQYFEIMTKRKRNYQCSESSFHHRLLMVTTNLIKYFTM